MSIRLVLVSAPVRMSERYGLLAGAGSTMPSFALALLAAVAARAGAQVHIVEASAHDLDIENTLRRVLAFEPDVVGMTATTSGIVACGELAANLKQSRPGLLTLIGGCHATALPNETLSEFSGFDIAVLGEGETTLSDIVRHGANPDRLAALPGLAVRTGAAITVNPRRAPIEDLDSLPLPDWSAIDGFPGAFRPSPMRIKQWPCASLVLTRGCPNQCMFCDRSVFGNQCRGYSPEYGVNLIADLAHTHGVKEILIEDDTFVIARHRVREFCERLIDRALGITWSCLGRADRVTPELLRLMRRAGCWHIAYGIESGNRAILELSRKNMGPEHVQQALAWTREAGLRTKGFFMVGLPGETRETLQQTREFAKSLPLDEISVMLVTPFPGSELFRRAEEFGTFDRDWRRMNALNPVFVPNGLTREELVNAQRQLIREFYLRPTTLARQALNLLARPRAAASVLAGIPALWRSSHRVRTQRS